jgi:hypothetical protein
MAFSVPRWIEVLAWLLLSTLVLAFLLLIHLTMSFIDNGFCVLAEKRTISSMPELEFTVEDLQCGFIGAVEYWNISVARSSGPLGWFGWGRTDIFRARSETDMTAVVTAIDPHTVRVSINRVSAVDFAKGRWEDLTILYDIGGFRYPSGPQSQPLSTY